MSDDERLAVEKAKQGDYTEFQLVLLKYSDELRRRIDSEIPEDVKTVIGADDVVQEVCLEALRDIRSFEWRGSGALQNWLNEIARTCLLDLVRAFRRKKRGGNRVGLRLSWVDVAEIVTSPTGELREEATPSRIARTNEAVAAVREAVAQLPNNERLAMRMYYLQHWSAEEGAEELGITPGAFRALLQRGRKRLRELLGRSSDWFSDHG